MLLGWFELMVKLVATPASLSLPVRRSLVDAADLIASGELVSSFGLRPLRLGSRKDNNADAQERPQRAATAAESAEQVMRFYKLFAGIVAGT